MGQKCCAEIPEKDFSRVRRKPNQQSYHIPDGLPTVSIPNIPYDVESTLQRLQSYRPKALNRPQGQPGPPK